MRMGKPYHDPCGSLATYHKHYRGPLLKGPSLAAVVRMSVDLDVDDPAN